MTESLYRKTKAALVTLSLAAFVCTLALSAANCPPLDSAPDAAICPVVYRLDDSPSPRGYHYAFFGNAFFINEQGYLLTDAHVLETFRYGGQPYLIVRRPNAPPRLLQAAIVATDPPHDVAILRATPNPFAGNFRVAFLQLATDPATPGHSVIAVSLHPHHLQDAQSLEAPREDRTPGQVLSYESTQLAESAPAAKVFLLSHPVTRGQCGSPVLTSDSHAVVGIIEGRWLPLSRRCQFPQPDCLHPGSRHPYRVRHRPAATPIHTVACTLSFGKKVGNRRKRIYDSRRLATSFFDGSPSGVRAA